MAGSGNSPLPFVFSPRPRAPTPPPAPARSLRPASQTGPPPPIRIGAGGLAAFGRGGGGVPRVSGAEEAVKRSGSGRRCTLIFVVSGRRHLSLRRGIVSRDRSCFCFDRLSGGLESAKAPGMLCHFPWTWTLVVSGTRAREENRRVFPPLPASSIDLQFQPPGACRLLLLAFGMFQSPNSLLSVLP